MSDRFSRDNAIGKILLNWWEGLADDRASRAILRRAGNTTAVVLSAPYQRLYRRLLGAGWSNGEITYLDDHLAAAIGLLAYVEQDRPLSPAAAMSQDDNGEDRPAVSELRFLRLLESESADNLLSGLRRVLPLMSYRVDVIQLANDVVHWDDKVKQRWAYTYKWPVNI